MGLWNYDLPIENTGIEVPGWIEQDITGTTVAAIKQGGCSSGAYMPAVTYSQAIETMAEHGNDVLQYIEDHWGEIPQPPRGSSWSGIAVFYLSFAVESWAATIEDGVLDLLDDD